VKGALLKEAKERWEVINVDETSEAASLKRKKIPVLAAIQSSCGTASIRGAAGVFNAAAMIHATNANVAWGLGVVLSSLTANSILAGEKLIATYSIST
jgi:hypothetical protein